MQAISLHHKPALSYQRYNTEVDLMPDLTATETISPGTAFIP